jgi:hypothetical protein
MSRAFRHRRWWRLAAPGFACLAAAAPAGAALFDGLPDAIVCSVDDPVGALPWNELVFYASARTESGAILYKSLTSNPVLLTVGVDGRVRAENLEDCDGRTAAELRAAGRAFDFRAGPVRR